MGLSLETSVQYIKGVGPKLGQLLAKRDIHTVSDLLNYMPRTFEDRRAARRISTLKEEEIVSLKAQIVRVQSITMGASKRRMFDVLVRDESGQINCKFFRVPYKGYFERLTAQKIIRLTGKVTNYRGKLEFHHPEIQDWEEEQEISDQLLPIYTEIESVTSQRMHKMIMLALAQVENTPSEKMPPVILQKYNLLKQWDALKLIHQPPANDSALYLNFQSPAHRRLIFDEFFMMELVLAARKAGFKKESGAVIVNPGELGAKLEKSLPFKLTNAQKRSCKEIFDDFASGKPMHRLVQGDVGSGKTLVSFLAALKVIESGKQAALMAPTEILAEQHFRSAAKFLEPLGIKTALLTGQTKASQRKEMFAQLSENKIHFIIGTHALIEDPVQFHDLALVVIDEQHRFGVHQRGLLKSKGNHPHFLVMTATPIPRTLALTAYGDLDFSVIDELPPGRSPIQTRVVFQNKKPQALSFIKEQLQKGRQAYVIYPLVEESEKIDLKNATDEFEALKIEFPEYKLGLLHGKMKSSEKDAVMEQFRQNEIQVLVSTTVVEVGVDVPNANIIMIEHAERFGLSQLHQLRGRVGRGEHKSFCLLILGYATSLESKERTQFLEKTTDGFKIAEYDLEIRGPGEFMGARQSGLTGFKLAHLLRDKDILLEAREAAFEVLQSDPSLSKSENAYLREELTRTHGPAFMASIA